jgi:hypothetical protein
MNKFIISSPAAILVIWQHAIILCGCSQLLYDVIAQQVRHSCVDGGSMREGALRRAWVTQRCPYCKAMLHGFNLQCSKK